MRLSHSIRNTWLVVALASCAIGTPTGGDAEVTSAPVRFIPTLAGTQPESGDKGVTTIVVGRKGEVKTLRAALEKSTNALKIEELPLIDACGLELSPSKRDAVTHLPAVAAVWVIPDPTFGAVYLRIIKALEYNIRTTSGVTPVNMSLGPPDEWKPFAFDRDEPMNLAARVAGEHRKVLVIAAGNGGPAPGSLSPWCGTDLVVCVGASTSDGTTVASFSGRGHLSGQGEGPTVVAAGVDVVVPHPAAVPKSSVEQAAERRSPEFQRMPLEKQAIYTVDTGTSVATAQVTAIAAQVVFFLDQLSRVDGVQSFEVDYEATEREALSATLIRMVGQVVKDDGKTWSVRYPVEVSPRMVKQLIMDMAVPVRGCGITACGSGFVSVEMARKYFGRFGVAETALQILKVL
jgi:hypothetical protein